MTRPTLVLVVHGSSIASARAATESLYETVTAKRPDIPVALAYLDHNVPRLDALLDDLPAGPVVVVPFLLAHAFHVRADIDSAAKASRATGRPVAVADVLAPHPRLVAAARDLVWRVAPDGAASIVLAAAGTSDETANDVTRTIAAELAASGESSVIAAFASAAAPTVTDALTALPPSRQRAIVLPWVLAPGRFAAAIVEAAGAAGAVCTDILGSHSALIEIVWERYDDAAATL